MEKTIETSDIFYEEFLSGIYDYCPYFGLGRSSEIDKFNGFYYRHLENETDMILEFGPGTGMLTVPLARMGYKLDSVDISPFMQDVLTAKLKRESKSVRDNVNQIVGDAITFNGDKLYNSIIMPEGVLIAIPDAAMQFDLLKNCNRNLKKGGRIYTDFFQPRYDVILKGHLTEYSRFKMPSGEIYLFTINYNNDAYTQIQSWDVEFIKMDKGRKGDIIRANVKFRYLFYSEITLLLKQAGFNIVEIDVTYADNRGFSVIAEKI
jgi:SAM-dependent methyltransferase